jgi:hypothetical protein
MLVMPNGKSLPADVYDVTRNADTKDLLQENIGTLMRKERIVPLVE